MASPTGRVTEMTSGRPLRVLGLVPYPIGRAPGQRYRIEQWAPHLQRDGIELAFAPFLSARGMDVLYRRGHLAAKASAVLRGHLRRLTEGARTRRFDVVYVYREATMLGPPWFEQLWLGRGGTPMVFDFDDAIYLPVASAANAWASRFKWAGKTAALCRLARVVTVGNDVLAEFARRTAQTVRVVPSTIDTDRYVPAPRPPNPRLVIGWTGSATTLPYLEAMAPTLRELRRIVDFDLRVIGGEVKLEGLSVQCVPWRDSTEVADLRPLDVGLMPLPDDEWSRAKCGLKALQYMALGIPPVVSPVGANRTIVRDGVNGFHADSSADWIDSVRRLALDPELRRRLGAAARSTVEEGYSARVQALRMGQALRDAAAS
jgi:glycosyltransferase involved in cell wall biosynthesis